MSTRTSDKRPATEVLEHAADHLEQLLSADVEGLPGQTTRHTQGQALVDWLRAEADQARLGDRIASPFAGLLALAGDPMAHHSPPVKAAVQYARTICPEGCPTP